MSQKQQTEQIKSYSANVLSKFAANMERYRQNEGLTRGELAKKIGVTTSTLSAYTTGRQKPNFDTICKLAEIFKIPVVDLFDGSAVDSAIEKAVEEYRVAEGIKIFYRIGWEVLQRKANDGHIILHQTIKDDEIQAFLTGNRPKDIPILDFKSGRTLATVADGVLNFLFRNLSNEKLAELNKKLNLIEPTA